MIRPIPALVLGILLAAGAHAVDTEAPLSDPMQQERYENLIHELRCLQCRSQSLADSEVELAGELRREVRRLVAEGQTETEVKAFLTARYGDYILFRPPLNERTWLLWLAPALLLTGGVLLTWRVVRHRTRLVSDDPEEFDAGDRQP